MRTTCSGRLRSLSHVAVAELASRNRCRCNCLPEYFVIYGSRTETVKTGVCRCDLVFFRCRWMFKIKLNIRQISIHEFGNLSLFWDHSLIKKYNKNTFKSNGFWRLFTAFYMAVSLQHIGIQIQGKILLEELFLPETGVLTLHCWGQCWLASVMLIVGHPGWMS